MTAGGGIQHEELPTERLYRTGGLTHAVQLWVNLPPALKMTTPRYQSITNNALRLLTSPDGGALVRLIAGDIAGFEGPGVTHTPISAAYGYQVIPLRPRDAYFSAVPFGVSSQLTTWSGLGPLTC